MLCIVFSAAQWNHLREDVLVKKVTIYNVPGHTAIDFIEDGNAWFLADSALRNDALTTKFHILPNRIIGGVAKVSPADTFVRQLEGCTLVVWNGLTILRLHDEKYRLPEKLAVDYLIVSNNSVKDLAELLVKMELKKVILDSSNVFYRADKLLLEAQQHRVSIFSVPHSGGFELTI